MIIGKVLAKRAFLTPDREALIFAGQSFTYSQLNQRANRLANAFLGLGIKPGERIGLLMYNSNQFLETYFAAAKIGAVLVPLNTRLAAPELDFILNDCTVSAFVFGAAFEQQVSEMDYPGKALHRISTAPSSLAGILDYNDLLKHSQEQEPSVTIYEDDLHVVMYTSGTTGRPKGAMLSHKNIYCGGLDMLVSLHYEYPDRLLVLGPFFHSGAITPFIGHVIRGVSTVIMESFDPLVVLQLIEEKKIKTVLGVTAIMQMLLEVPDLESYNLDSWEIAILPGSPLPFQVIKEAHDRLGVLCQNLWGLTEMSGPGTHTNIDDILHMPDCVGKPFFNVEVRVVGLAGNELTPGEMGEIVIRGPNMMQGYWNQTEATKKTIKDGWLYTGDMGKLDEKGYLYVMDRIKDMIVSGGENVYPAEIEKIIREINAVKDVSVIGIADAKWGEVPKAFIEIWEEATLKPDEIIAFCRQKLAGYKVPKYVEFIDALPRNPSGKVLKKELRSLSR